jgi:hypothetical protein
VRCLPPVLAVVAITLAVCACSSDPALSSSSSGTSGSGTSGASFSKDVFPLVVAQCSLTACHGSKQSNLGIFLSNDATQIYSELQKTSPTANLPFVVPGDATKSYLMLKIDGKQCATCGTEMPPDAILPQKDRDTFRAWITAGAKND